jgi:hypothetical protein
MYSTPMVRQYVSRNAVTSSRNVTGRAWAARRNAVKGAGIERPVQVGFGETEFGQFKQRVAGPRLAERVKAGHEMTNVAVGVNQPHNARLQPAFGVGARMVRKPEVETFKEAPPRLIDGRRVLTETLVVGFEEFQVPGIANGTVIHDDRVPAAFGSWRLRDAVPSIIIRRCLGQGQAPPDGRKRGRSGSVENLVKT